jgi:hypothetical protein
MRSPVLPAAGGVPADEVVPLPPLGVFRAGAFGAGRFPDAAVFFFFRVVDFLRVAFLFRVVAFLCVVFFFRVVAFLRIVFFFAVLRAIVSHSVK